MTAPQPTYTAYAHPKATEVLQATPVAKLRKRLTRNNCADLIAAHEVALSAARRDDKPWFVILGNSYGHPVYQFASSKAEAISRHFRPVCFSEVTPEGLVISHARSDAFK